MSRKAWLICPLAITASAVQAQVRGTVRDAATSVALPGAVVTALDSNAVTHGRVITDVDGRFVLAAGVKTTQLRFIRIGYRPRVVSLASGDTIVAVTMERLPRMLNTVRVTSNELCPGSADQGAAFQLWEQARAGLLATIVSRESKPATATTMLYETHSFPADQMVQLQKKSVKSGQTTRPFLASSPPSFFARVGYMLEDRTMRTYNAPDADVLVDESFAATHCFRLRYADAAHAGEIGLAFSPVPGRDTLVDVDGVIWLDVQDPALRSLDFVYTSLEPAATDANSGGHIEFRTMKNGVSFIERWNLRMVTLEPISVAETARMQSAGWMRRVRRIDRHNLRAADIVDAGGIVVRATWPDGERYDDSPGGVTGLVRQRNGLPAANVLVTLDGTTDTVRTDDRGAFRIVALPGRYAALAVDTALSRFVAPRMESAPVTVARATFSPAVIEIPEIDRVITKLCDGQRRPTNSIVLLGAVAMSDTLLPRKAEIVASWQADYANDEHGLQIQTRSQVVNPDGRGRFVVCGAARERPIQLRLRNGSDILGDTTIKYVGPDATVPVNWTVHGPR
jgi:hypothetical protein